MHLQLRGVFCSPRTARADFLTLMQPQYWDRLTSLPWCNPDTEIVQRQFQIFLYHKAAFVLNQRMRRIPKEELYALLQVPSDPSHDRRNHSISLETSSPYAWLGFLTGIKEHCCRGLGEMTSIYSGWECGVLLATKVAVEKTNQWRRLTTCHTVSSE